MNLSALQTLTWSTVVGAVVSALALASGGPIVPERERTVVDGPGVRLHLPTEPTAAGRREPPAASAARESVSLHAMTVGR
jgi:hypothetical protein